jgi:hypothetical protein
MAQGLPYFQGVSKDVQLLQSGWFKVLNPFFKQSISAPVILTQQKLVSGVNTISHGLGYPLTGWQIIRKRIWETGGVITSYDVMDEQDQDLLVSPKVLANSTPQNTLILFCTQGTASNPVVIDLAVF